MTEPTNNFTPMELPKIQVIDSAGFPTPGVKYAALTLDPQNGRLTMKYLITGLIIAALSTVATAGATAPVQVPEPGMLGLFAVSLTALLIARKFRK